MVRPALYGKRPRLIGGQQILSFSSPEQEREKATDRASLQPKRLEYGISRKDGDSVSTTHIKPRQREVLNEKSANVVVLPVVEIGERAKKTKPRSRRKKEQEACNEQQVKGSRRRPEGIGQEVVLEVDVIARANDRNRARRKKSPGKTRKSSRTPSPTNIEPHIIVRDGCQSLHDTPNVYKQHCSSLLSLSLRPDSSFQQFESWAAELAAHFHVSKIAEASFGEVYRLSLTAEVPEFTRADESVFKIIALRRPPRSNPVAKPDCENALDREDHMSDPEDVANEVRLLQRMSCIPGFTNFRDVRVVQGPPAGPFVAAFREFDASQRAKGKEGSHFADPGCADSYSSTQLWAVIEMQDAGTDLERLMEAKLCTPIWSVWDLFWSIVLALAKGEQGAEFEHRDLHLGNVCVHRLPRPGPGQKFYEMDVDVARKLSFTPLETTIIDYTISRATLVLPSESAPCPAPAREVSNDRNVAYHDLSLDPAIFEGDSTEEYQYDIYRYMRGVFFSDDAYHDFENSGGDESRSWSQYHPQTNLVWLHFILYKLLCQSAWPSKVREPKVSKQKKGGVPKSDSELRRARWSRGKELESILLHVQEMLDPGQICTNGMRSAGDLVALALHEQWIDVDDVTGGRVIDDDVRQEEAQLASALDSLALEDQTTGP